MHDKGIDISQLKLNQRMGIEPVSASRWDVPLPNKQSTTVCRTSEKSNRLTQQDDSNKQRKQYSL
jgi:hypothetical protein